MTTQNPSEIVPIEVLAKRLRLSKAFLKRETRAGRIPALRAGNQTRYNPEAVIAALAKRAAGQDAGCHECRQELEKMEDEA